MLFKKNVLGSCREAGCSMWHFLKACEYELAWFWLSGVEVFSRWALTARYSESHTCPATRQLSLRVSDTDMEAGSSLLFRTCIHLFMEIICQGIFGLAAFCLTDASCHFLTCLSWLQGRTWPEKQAWMSQKKWVMQNPDLESECKGHKTAHSNAFLENDGLKREYQI